ncbi:MAG TPA: phenol degradation protein meta [Rhodoferax sp.]|uniref:SphA family protein n=1 Tax=Rhodoferax sp. TaxID=50421 RepID=UPI000B13BABB|nr:transporter [Rhodoferax sp.]HCX82942.1 phenol degradation protein meta [Rhodoferax sp.]
MNSTFALGRVPGYCGVCLLPLLAGYAFAQTPSVTQPGGLNLGVTSFYDGFSGGPGWAWQTTLRHSDAKKMADANGNASAIFKDPSIQSDVMVNQLSYAFTQTMGGWRPALMVIVPVVTLDTHFGQGPSLKSGGTGLGDISLDASLQSEPATNADGGRLFVQRFAASLILPTGEYKKDVDINQGSGYASFNPYWAATLFPAPRWEMSWRAHYLYNFKNESPAASRAQQINGQAVTNTQAGDAAWINFAASYAITPDVSLGINGYYFEQLSNNRANGVELADTKERVLGIGPGMMWRINPKQALWFNAYTESMARNRAASNLNLQVRTVFSF